MSVEDWLDDHGHKLAFGWLGLVAVGLFTWGVVESGLGETLKTVLVVVGLMCLIVFTFISGIILVAKYDNE